MKFGNQYKILLLYNKSVLFLIKSFIFTLLLFFSTAYHVQATDSTDTSAATGDSGTGETINDVLNAEEGGTLDTILDTLTSLTCETQGIGNLLRSEFTHTCIPRSLFTFAIANIISPGVYANTFLRLTINDEELFPGACKRQNRAEFNDPRISFGMCSNTKLAIERASAIADVGFEITQSLFTDENTWDLILEAWNLPKESYHNMYLDKEVGFQEDMFDAGIIPIFPIKVIKEQDKICVATQSFSGWIPIGCKFIKEPYPESIYADFFNPESDVEETQTTALTKCAGLGSCYRRAYDSSRASVVMSSPVIECVQEMIAKLMISRDVCSFSDFRTVFNTEARSTSALFEFQQNMHQIVSSLLAIYITLFGFRVILSGNVPQKKELVAFLAKFIFVVYFSVGINIGTGANGEFGRMDGMVQWAFPLLLEGMNSLGGWVANSGPSQLCVFNDVQYPQGMGHMQLWDALDCRVSHYLGLDRLLSFFASLQGLDNGSYNSDTLMFPIPSYFFLLIPSVMTGIPFIVVAVLAYPLLVISLLGFIVNATVVCMIGIVVLGILAPLFVPAYLFSFTEGYFKSWVKLLVSFMLQPMVIITFMVAMLSLNDYGMYSTCLYRQIDTSFSDPGHKEKLEAFGFTIPDTGLTGAGREFRMFEIDVDWRNYENEDQIRACQESLGFFMDFPKDAIEGTANEIEVDENGVYKNYEGLGSVILTSPGIFFDMVELIYQNLEKWLIQLMTMCLIAYLMTQFADQIAEFAADMTEGASISGMSMLKPNTLSNAGKKAVGVVVGAVKKTVEAAVVVGAGVVTVATGGTAGAPIAAGITVAKGALVAAKGVAKAGSKAATVAAKKAAKVAAKVAKKVVTKAASKLSKEGLKKTSKEIGKGVVKQVGRDALKTGQEKLKERKANIESTFNKMKGDYGKQVSAPTKKDSSESDYRGLSSDDSNINTTGSESVKSSDYGKVRARSNSVPNISPKGVGADSSVSKLQKTNKTKTPSLKREDTIKKQAALAEAAKRKKENQEIERKKNKDKKNLPKPQFATESTVQNSKPQTATESSISKPKKQKATLSGSKVKESMDKPLVSGKANIAREAKPKSKKKKED